MGIVSTRFNIWFSCLRGWLLTGLERASVFFLITVDFFKNFSCCRFFQLWTSRKMRPAPRLRPTRRKEKQTTIGANFNWAKQTKRTTPIVKNVEIETWKRKKERKKEKRRRRRKQTKTNNALVFYLISIYFSLWGIWRKENSWDRKKENRQIQ